MKYPLRIKLFTAIIAGFLFTVCLMSSAFASVLLFEGKNPALFSGANPAGFSPLMSSVLRPTDPDSTSLAEMSSPAALIQRAVASQISTEINNQIFDTANPSGSYDLGDGNLISFIREGGNVIITITSPTTGVTVITLPDI